MECFVKHNPVNKPQLFYIDKWMNSYPGLSAGFSSRRGGVSSAEMNSLNCALHVQDNPLHVIENRRRVADTVGFSFNAWTCAEQVHGKEVVVVTKAEKGMGKQSREGAIQSKDALITSEHDIMLTAFFADCVPLYFFDPVRKVIGLAHAGWKGTVLDIVNAAVMDMRNTYGTQPHHIVAAIGPSIGGCCYEVDDNVIKHVPDTNVFKQKESGKWMLDLKEMNRRFMIKAGILPTNIEITRLCTSCNTDLFFSHRKEQGRTGRMVAWIALNEG